LLLLVVTGARASYGSMMDSTKIWRPSLSIRCALPSITWSNETFGAGPANAFACSTLDVEASFGERLHAVAATTNDEPTSSPHTVMS